MAWKAAGAVREVVGVARRAETLAEAIRLGAIDRGTLHPEEGAEGADVVVIATPVRTIVPVAEAIQKCLKPGAVVTDVGSTKAWVCEAVWRAYGEDALFIGGHPMAGSERAGVGAADPYLFQNAPYVLVPPPRPAQEGLALLERLVRATGAVPMVMSAAEHDAIVATVSHLPHMVAASLVNTATRRSETFPALLQLAAGGFRDTTRVASGLEDVWLDICQTNARPIVESIDVFIDVLTQLRDALSAGDEERLRSALAAARRAREQLPAKSKGILGTVYDLVVRVEDRPGAIHGVTGVISRAGINIIDIEILRVREGEGGTLRLGFEREEDLQEALRLLREAGYQARSR